MIIKAKLTSRETSALFPESLPMLTTHPVPLGYGPDTLDVQRCVARTKQGHIDSGLKAGVSLNHYSTASYIWTIMCAY